MKRWLLGVTLLGALSLILVACGGQASGDTAAEAAAPADAATPAEPPSGEETIAVAETESADAETKSDNKNAAKKNKRNKKKNKKNKTPKKLQVPVGLGAPDEFDLVPAKKQVKAGMATFKLKNTGAIEHELVVIRTDLDSGDLPTDENGAAVEHGAIARHGAGHDAAQQGAAHVGAHVPSGQATSVALMLEPGTYALVCNLPGHYAAGMHSSFTVVS